DENIEGISFSIAGPVTEGAGMFTNLPSQPRIAPDDFKDICPNVILLNDAVAAVYAEYTRDPHPNMVYITISSGIGGGVIQNDEIVYFKGTDEEIGHIEIEARDYRLSCGCKPGKFNHWEALCAGGVLVDFFEAWKVIENDTSGLHPKQTKDIFSAAKKGNKTAKRFLQEGFGWVNRQAFEKVIQKYQPEKIVLGGSVAANNQDEITDGLKDLANLPQVSFTDYGDDISLIGASKYLFHQLLTNAEKK
ncbi:MAG: ROK family protein, partial [Patescibacteria group bacterium]